MAWRTVKLGEVCTIEKGNIGILKAIPGEYPLVVLGEERRTHNEYQFDNEAVIIPLVSSTGHGHRSMKRIFYQTGKFSVGSILCAVIPKDKSKLSAEFLYRYLDFNKEKELVARMKGMANVSLPMKEIAAVEIPLPPIEHQKKLIEEFQKLETSNNQIATELSHQLELVRQLRQAFLREAMQGKLVAQDAADEPAGILLAKIKAEKEKLIAAKKIKKDKPLPEIKPEEISFETPNNWTWCRLAEVCEDTEGGKSPNCKNAPANNSEWGVIKTTAVQFLRFIEKENKVLSKDFSVNPKHKIHKEDILITRAGPKNRVAIVCHVDKINQNLILSDKTIRIKYFAQFIHPQFLAIALNSEIPQTFMKSKMVGMAECQVNISQENMKLAPFLLPPLTEQKRIVAKLATLMKFCDELEANIRASKANAETLLQVALKEALAG